MRTFSTDSARQTLALRLLRARLRIESGRRMDFLPADSRIAEALLFAPTSTATRSSRQHKEYWKGMAAKASGIAYAKITSVFGR